MSNEWIENGLLLFSATTWTIWYWKMNGEWNSQIFCVVGEPLFFVCTIVVYYTSHISSSQSLEYSMDWLTDMASVYDNDGRELCFRIFLFGHWHCSTHSYLAGNGPQYIHYTHIDRPYNVVGAIDNSNNNNVQAIIGCSSIIIINLDKQKAHENFLADKCDKLMYVCIA